MLTPQILDATVLAVTVIVVLIAAYVIATAPVSVYPKAQRLSTTKTPKLLEKGLTVVVSKDYKGAPFLNVLMPNGEELPCVRTCTIKSDYKDCGVAVATIELLVNVDEIKQYTPPTVTFSASIKGTDLLSSMNRLNFVSDKTKVK